MISNERDFVTLYGITRDKWNVFGKNKSQILREDTRTNEKEREREKENIMLQDASVHEANIEQGKEL